MDSTTTQRQLSRYERRVIGTLVEKAKTTPGQYPMSLNALVNGCNQKSNRSPVMELDEEHVDNALERLRELGACVEVQADSRTPKYRHTMYEWLGIDKVELAVMTELLLRGDQTVGELRGRAARMDPIDGMSALRPILQSLAAKKLIVYLTPQGRGCIVTHNLYQPQEMEKLRAKYNAPDGGFDGDDGDGEEAESEPKPIVRVADDGEVTVESSDPAVEVPKPSQDANPDNTHSDIHTLRGEIASLREDLLETRTELTQLLSELQRSVEEVRQQISGM